MRDAAEWVEADLLALIANNEPESLTLEYKAAAALDATPGKKKEIGKDVSAFANSVGGTIVYGLAEDPDDRTPTALDGLDPAVVSPEWLDQVITSNIQYRIDGLRINAVSLSDNKVAYVVVIPQSPRAPHMANDNRYYKRFNARTEAMEHYEVEDVRRRTTNPNLTMQLSARRMYTDTKNDPPMIGVDLFVVVANDSPTPASHALLEVLLDMRVKVTDARHWQGRTLVRLEDGPDLNSLAVTWSISDRLPIWEGTPLAVGDLISIEIPMFPDPPELDVVWRARSPGMKEAIGRYKLRVIRGVDAELVSVDTCEGPSGI